MKRSILLILALALAVVSCQRVPVANCLISPNPAYTGEQVIFENTSVNAEIFEWDFGDGSTSSNYSPAHIYAQAGTYHVTLTAYGRNGDFDVAVFNVDVLPLLADFTITTDLPFESGYIAVQTDMVYIGEAVTFNNESTAGLDYQWDFGDGYGSTSASPVYSYDTPGTYTVTLSVQADGYELTNVSALIQVFAGYGSTVRITVKEFWDEYPVPDATVKLYPSLDDWNAETNLAALRYSSNLGKTIFENLQYQSYYVDVWEAHHDNYTLASEDVNFIITQELEPGYINDFFAYVDYYADGKKATLTSISKKKLAAETVKGKDIVRTSDLKKTRFSKTIKNAEE